MKKRNLWNQPKIPKRIKWKFALAGGVLILVCWSFWKEAGDTSLAKVFFQNLKSDLFVKAVETHMPLADTTLDELENQTFVWEMFSEKIMAIIPGQKYLKETSGHDTRIESTLHYESGKITETVDGEHEKNQGQSPKELEETEKIQILEKQEEKEQEKKKDRENPKEPKKETEKVVTISREKLEDFDYLIQNFYTIDKTTTIDSSQLKVKEFLEKDMSLQTSAEKPQILILHTHSQERYADSNEDINTSIVGVGEYLTKLLTEKYGFFVIHDTGVYDVQEHDDAYAHAAAGIEKILEENPSIEVIIDMHRDGIKEGKLVTEINGKPTAKIMFFNGLSKTTKNGNLSYLPNPNLEDNLAFSLQMKIAAEEYYPGFARTNYLKGYRYNLHYRPKSMLVEIGAQTNTVQEAMNAMEPLADLLHKVLSK